MEWFVEKNVNRKALNVFFDAMDRDNFEVHTLQVYRGEQCLLRLAREPYSCGDAREVYSLSKMFASTVVGIAVEQGLVRTEDRLVDIFERKNASEKMSHITVKHLLSMNTGHDRCIIPEMSAAENSLEAFFGIEPVYEPGTHFAYNTGASCMLCSVIERVSGKDFFDYACENLFYPMGITDITWKRCVDGTCIGGAGLSISSDDIIKLGMMYKNGGLYRGERILSEKWIREASSCVSDNSTNGTPDWCSGYGYQLWRNSREGYRGDGAYGQLCVILPERDMVVAVQAFGINMQQEMDHLFAFLDDMDGEGQEGSVYSFEPLVAKEALPKMDGIYLLEENPADFRSVWVTSDRDSLALSFSDGGSIQTVRAKAGCWTVNRCSMRNMQPFSIGRFPAERREPLVMAVCCGQEGNKTVLVVRYRTSPHAERWELTRDGSRLHITCAELQNGEIRMELSGNLLRKEK